MPNLPNLPGLNILMRLPDKLLRAELSMLQDEIRMAQQMMQNPLSATMNAPKGKQFCEHLRHEMFISRKY